MHGFSLHKCPLWKGIGGLVLGGSTEDMVEQYLFSVLHGQYQWWGGEVCSNGHGGGERERYRWKGLPSRTLVFERQKCAHLNNDGHVLWKYIWKPQTDI
jgi:hypothetical protein